MQNYILYLVILGFLLFVILTFTYLSRERLISTYKIWLLAKKFLKGDSENSDKKEWELLLGSLAFVPSGIKAFEKYYPIYKDFLQKHYPGLKPEYSVFDPDNEDKI
ncbi:hypothetical protein CHH83_05840 [Bacillus sp. 7586-K]|nr:hypothetical protein CHH83_05840 [Bacillus sp. 7586-K]